LKRAHLVGSIVLALGLLAAFIPVPWASAQEKIVGEDHWVSSISAADGKPLKLYVREKRLKDIDVKEFPTTGRVVLLLQGTPVPGHILFDLQVPGNSGLTYSLMDYLAEHKFDVFTVDYQNHGRSDKHECGLCVIAQVVVNDIDAVVDYIRGLRGVKQVYLLGFSWGTTTGGLYTMQRPHRVKRLVLDGLNAQKGPVDIPPTAQFRLVTEEGIKGSFEPQATDAVVVATYVKEALKFPNAPNGALFDIRNRYPIAQPRQITVPTMIIMGSLDRATPITQPELPGFFAELANPDKQFIIVPGAGHMLHVQKPRLRFFTEVLKWFSLD
jgi:pimeloyl-ACP methyl ester carboxylesterase